MSRPFAGMDPWLEDPAFWQDFHRRFTTEIATALLGVLPDGYDARMNRSTRIVDVEPATSLRETEEVRDVWIEVRHRDERDLVTVIEVLSPANKLGRGWSDFDARRRHLVEQHVNLVEVDLLLGGRRVELSRPLPPDDCYGIVTRDTTRLDERPTADVYHWPIEAPLPPLPIPLRPPDPDVILELAPVFESTWTRGRYARVLRYDRYTPPLAGPRLAALRERIEAWRGSIATRA